MAGGVAGTGQRRSHLSLSPDEPSIARFRQDCRAIPDQPATQISRGDTRPHRPPMVRRPAHLGPVLDARLVEDKVAAFHHAYIGIRADTQCPLAWPQSMHPRTAFRAV